jgi:hypothetical protein
VPVTGAFDINELVNLILLGISFDEFVLVLVQPPLEIVLKMNHYPFLANKKGKAFSLRSK